MTQSIPKSITQYFTGKRFKHGIINRIGDTPLIEIPPELIGMENCDVTIMGKAEWFNPGGSVKDRPAWNMIKHGLLDGELNFDKTIIDASSGNTGIALALVGSALNIPVSICIPANASPERFQLLKAYGATIIKTDPLEGTDGAIMKAREMVNEDPDSYFYTDQYNNDNNWKAHYEHTAREILVQTNNEITHFVTGLGTSGTFSGVTKRLKDELDTVSCIAMEPESPFHGLEGLKHLESAITPGIYDNTLADELITVTTTEAQEMTKKLAREAGILVGVSSGANVVAAGKVAKNVEEGTIVTILCDRGERYMTDKFWRDEV